MGSPFTLVGQPFTLSVGYTTCLSDDGSVTQFRIVSEGYYWQVEYPTILVEQFPAKVKADIEARLEFQKAAPTPFDDDEFRKEISKEENMPHEALVAKRAWRFNFNSGRLCSVHNHTVWPPRSALHADCSLAPGVRGHSAPAEGCSCGVYALRLNQSVLAYSDGQPLWGEVYLWGRIRHGVKGYRAEYAYPKQFETMAVNGAAPWWSSHLVEAYGIPVIVHDKLPD